MELNGKRSERRNICGKINSTHMQQLWSAQHCDLSELTFVAVGEEEETSLLRVAAHKVVNNDTWQLNHSAIE